MKWHLLCVSRKLSKYCNYPSNIGKLPKKIKDYSKLVIEHIRLSEDCSKGSVSNQQDKMNNLSRKRKIYIY